MRAQTPTMFNFLVMGAIAFAVTIFLLGEAAHASAEFDSLSVYPAVKTAMPHAAGTTHHQK